MKNATGTCWKYRNCPARGMTWAAELKVGNAIFCTYGQKNLKSALAVASAAAKKLGWELVEPWEKLPERSKR